MTRVLSHDGTDHPSLDREQVRTFFEDRAQKARQLGPTQAVIYQDKHPELAAARDRAEKALLLPALAAVALQGGRQRRRVQPW